MLMKLTSFYLACLSWALCSCYLPYISQGCGYNATPKVIAPIPSNPFEELATFPLRVKKILRFLYERQEYDNRIINLSNAVICRETGRVFSNVITWYDTVELDWSFINKRYPGHYVSWGSLNDLQQVVIREAHFSLSDFQTNFSCPNPSPKAVTPEYIYVKPGPLYVDMQTKVLVGWQCVPDSDFEVLIVQQPQKIIIQKPEELKKNGS